MQGCERTRECEMHKGRVEVTRHKALEQRQARQRSVRSDRGVGGNKDTCHKYECELVRASASECGVPLAFLACLVRAVAPRTWHRARHDA